MSHWKLLAASLPLALLGVAGTAQAAAGNAENGKAVFEKNQCSVCHKTDSNEKTIGPGLKGIKDGKLPSGKDATYENILQNLDTGGGGMPSYKDRLSQTEKDDVIAYVMSL
jgi:mono/diheme cytochrome c family protein